MGGGVNDFSGTGKKQEFIKEHRPELKFSQFRV
jgi:hypothetical protein